MHDLRRHDAALGAATTIWQVTGPPLVLPLTVALAAIQGVRMCMGPFPRLAWGDAVHDW
jgi:hypothetical protein